MSWCWVDDLTSLRGRKHFHLLGWALSPWEMSHMNQCPGHFECTSVKWPLYSFVTWNHRLASDPLDIVVLRPWSLLLVLKVMVEYQTWWTFMRHHRRASPCSRKTWRGCLWTVPHAPQWRARCVVSVLSAHCVWINLNPYGSPFDKVILSWVKGAESQVEEPA